MAVNINQLQYNEIGYVVTKFLIVVRDSKGNLVQKDELKTVQVKNFFIEKNFDEDYTPIFMVELAIDDKLYRNICKYQRYTTCTIMIKYGKVAEDNTISKLSTYLSGDFVPMQPDDTPFVNEKEYNKQKEEYDGGMSMQTFGRSYTLILGKKSVIKKTRKIINNVLTSANMLDAICFLLTSAGISSKVLMSTLDNMSTYNEVILLPIPLTSQLSYLNSVFGFYKQGAQIFFDFDYSYILRNSDKCTAYMKNEIKKISFCIYNASSGKGSTKGSVTKDKVGYISCTSTDFQYDDESKSSDSYMSANTMIINQSGSVSTAVTNSSGSYNVINSTTHNPYYANEVKLRTKELEGIVYMSCKNIDLTYLTPNKQFVIQSNVTEVAKKVNHKFRLSSWMSVFSKEGNIFKASTNIVMKKTD